MLGCVGDERVARGCAQHDVLGEDRAGELDSSVVHIDGGWYFASLDGGAENVADWLEDAFHEATLSGNEGSVAVGVVEQSCEKGPEWLRGESFSEGEEGGGEVILEVVADAGRDVGRDDSVDGVDDPSQPRPIRQVLL